MSFTQKYCTWLLIALTVFVVLKEASSGSSVSTEAEETLCQVSGETFLVDCESLRIK